MSKPLFIVIYRQWFFSVTARAFELLYIKLYGMTNEEYYNQTHTTHNNHNHNKTRQMAA